MNALQQTPPPVRARPPLHVVAPPPARPPRRRPRPQAAPASHRAEAAERAVKLAANAILALAAAVALARLVPGLNNRQLELQELQAELQAVEARADRLKAEFDREFDPQQSVRSMQDGTQRLRQNQRQVVWLDAAPDEPEPSDVYDPLQP